MLAGAYGLLMANNPPADFTHIPISLRPCEFDRGKFERIKDKTSLHNEMMLAVSRDRGYMYEVLEEVCLVDEFTRRLVDLSKKTAASGHPQPILLGLTRNDFMFDQALQTFLQVEYNTIASSFLCLGTKIIPFHEHVSSLTGHAVQVASNSVLENYSNAISKAYNLYGGQGFILFVVLPDEKNLFDQTGIEVELFKHGIKVIRASLLDLSEFGSIAASGELFYKSHEIAIAYFRSGYVPEHYIDERAWKGRELIELSKAIKCPNIDFHIAGCKKIQQRLAIDLPRFTNSIQEIRENLTEIYDFSGIDSDLQAKVRERPEDWVLKPQREGGGNNVYGKDILKFIESKEEHKEFILMKMIHCKESECFMVRRGQLSKVNAVSELGLFGALVVNGDQVVVNEYSGYLVRTKSKDSNEGGVAAGYAVIDSAALVD